MELKSKDFFDVAQNPADQVYYKSTKIVKAGRETYEKRPRRLSGDVSFSGGMRFVEFAGDVQQRLQVEVTRYRAKHRRYLEPGSLSSAYWREHSDSHEAEEGIAVLRIG